MTDSTTEPTSSEMPEWERVLRDLETDYRADHHFAATADHPAMKDRIDRDVEAALAPIRELLTRAQADVARIASALARHHEHQKHWRTSPLSCAVCGELADAETVADALCGKIPSTAKLVGLSTGVSHD